MFTLKGLSETQYKCIELLCDENMEITKIAKELNICRGTIYNWMKDERFKAELDSREQDIKNRVQRLLLQRLTRAYEKLWNLTDATDKRTALNALKEWIERAQGKVSASVMVEDKRTTTDESSLEDILKVVDDMLKQEESSKNTAP